MTRREHQGIMVRGTLMTWDIMEEGNRSGDDDDILERNGGDDDFWDDILDFSSNKPDGVYDAYIPTSQHGHPIRVTGIKVRCGQFVFTGTATAIFYAEATAWGPRSQFYIESIEWDDEVEAFKVSCGT